MLCVLKSVWWNQVQHVVKGAILCISVAKAICRFDLVGNCMFLLFRIGIHWCFGFLPVSVVNNIGVFP